MIKIITFNEIKNLSFLEKFLRTNGIQYIFEKIDRELYVKNYLFDDSKTFDLLIITNDTKQIKRDIRNVFNLKNGIDKNFSRNVKHYDANSSLMEADFDDCTLPQGFLSFSQKEFTTSFWGRINKNLLICIDDKSTEIEYLSTIKEIMPFFSIIKTSCFKMLFIESDAKRYIEDSLLELSCHGFSWSVFEEKGGIIALYLYFLEGISDFVIANIEKTVYSLFAKNIYADFDASLAEVLVHMASMANIKISTAESLTGGLVADKIVSVSGASKIFDYGIVSYSNQAKEDLLGVNNSALNEHGAVSSQVAEQMAKGLISRFNCDIGVATTGIAGPTGQTLNKPIGLVYIGIATSSCVFSEKFLFEGEREHIRQLSANMALFNVIKMINKI